MRTTILQSSPYTLRYVRIPGIKVTRSSRTATASLPFRNFRHNSRIARCNVVFGYYRSANEEWATFGLFSPVFGVMTSEKSDPSCKLHAIFIELSICHVDVVRNQIIITGSITKMFPLQSCTYRSTATPNNETMIIKNGSTSQNHKRPCPLNIPLIIRTRTRTTWKRAQAETRDAPSSSGILLFQQQVIDSHLVFAYPFHFGKSGFSAYFSRHIRISGFYPDFFVQVRIGPYILFSSCK